MLTIIQISFIIASISILWRSTLNKNKKIGKYLKNKFPVFLGTALTCGLCFTYWISLFFILLYQPLDFFMFNTFDNPTVKHISHTFLSWMFVGFISVFLRFLYVLLQEKVNQIYSINNGGVHDH